MLRLSAKYRLFISFIVLVFFTSSINAQLKNESDTFFLAKKNGLWGKLGKSISVSGETPISTEDAVKKNEDNFSRFKGKIIHSIKVQKLDFNSSINDTSSSKRNFFNDLGNFLHTTSSEKIIKRNLFFNIGDSLYPALVADNERFLRDISYLQDAKILIKENIVFKNEVDVLIVCKDVFPIGGSADLGSEKMLNFEINDDNLAGRGDRIAIKNLIDLDRTPYFGIGGQYLKRNFLGSFVNISIGLSTIEPGFNSGRKEETAWYFKADLPLVSPYSVWTGSYETSFRYTNNNFTKDSLYQSDFKYNYRILDGWLGYNIGAKKDIGTQIKNRLKHLLAIRGAYRRFFDIPNFYQTNYNSSYSDLTTVLSSLTVFEQDYYHTNFIYGFGRNEDVPEGFSMSLTGGWTNRNNIERPYLGYEYQRAYFTRKKAYVNYQIRMGTYFYQSKFEDISFLSSVELFTRLRKLGNSKWLSRHFISASITQQMNSKLNDPLYLYSVFGIQDFNNASNKTNTRISGNWESVFYNTWKFFGFSFAPFVFTNLSYVNDPSQPLANGDVYSAFGSGVRTRNENLVFGTMELRASYYPRTIGSMKVWNIIFNTALQFKYNSQLVKRPDFVLVN